jgi:hypothetical protein
MNEYHWMYTYHFVNNARIVFEFQMKMRSEGTVKDLKKRSRKRPYMSLGLVICNDNNNNNNNI